MEKKIQKIDGMNERDPGGECRKIFTSLGKQGDAGMGILSVSVHTD